MNQVSKLQMSDGPIIVYGKIFLEACTYLVIIGGKNQMGYHYFRESSAVCS